MITSDDRAKRSKKLKRNRKWGKKEPMNANYFVEV